MSKDRALLVEIPATALWTFVPTAPGGLGGRGVFGTFNLGTFGILGGLIRMGLRDPPTRDVGIGSGEGGIDSGSECVIAESSGLGGGRTSPGTITLRLR